MALRTPYIRGLCGHLWVKRSQCHLLAVIENNWLWAPILLLQYKRGRAKRFSCLIFYFINQKLLYLTKAVFWLLWSQKEFEENVHHLPRSYSFKQFTKYQNYSDESKCITLNLKHIKLELGLAKFQKTNLLTGFILFSVKLLWNNERL